MSRNSPHGSASAPSAEICPSQTPSEGLNPRRHQKTLDAPVSVFTPQGCADLVQNYRADQSAPPNNWDCLRFFPSRPVHSTQPSTFHPQPTTPADQLGYPVVHSLHSTYYCCCQLLKGFLLEEGPWGKPSRAAHSGGVSWGCQPWHLTFKMGTDALRLVIGLHSTGGVAG